MSIAMILVLRDYHLPGGATGSTGTVQAYARRARAMPRRPRMMLICLL